jgi:hypothetical protein
LSQNKKIWKKGRSKKNTRHFVTKQKRQKIKNKKINLCWIPAISTKNRGFRPIQNTSAKKILFCCGRFSMDFSKWKKLENCRVFPGLLGVRLPQNYNSK